MSSRADLRAAYANAIYTVELPGGTVTFRSGRPAQGPAPAHSLAVLTAWNPGSLRPGDAANRAANRRLAAALREDGREAYPAMAAGHDGAHAEPSFAVPAIGPEQALAYARRFHQAAVFFWDGRTGRLLWTDREGRKQGPR